jgi:hypothetical protein
MDQKSTVTELLDVCPRWLPVVAAVSLALAIASAAATWVAEQDTQVSAPAPPGKSRDSTPNGGFNGRFAADLAKKAPPSAAEIRLVIAKGLLAQKLSDDVTMSMEMANLEEPPAAPSAPAVPLPRPRPAEASAPSREADAGRDDQTLFRKLSEIFRPRATLAALTPYDGMQGEALDLTALGYDGTTAVYDISARVVYLPNGLRLEAHSGYGDTKDDPKHVNERMVGATPPAVYDLKPREKLFHGIQALRMVAVEGSTLGRSGLLTHGYMLGPNGDSNGCVSIKDYDRFLAAFQKGDIKRLAVVTSLSDLTIRQSSL